MKKTLIAVVMTIVLAIVFTACGSGKSNSTPASQETSGQEGASEVVNNNSADSEPDADTDESIQNERGEDYEESVEVMVPEESVEEMVPEESVQLEIEEGQQGALG